MGCPHTIEPHQIQGNDFINIFPVIQWLVKKSVENRSERADKLKRFAVGQFHNEFTLESDRQQKEKNLKVLANVQKVQDTFAPKRQFKRKDAGPDDEKTRVRITLLEYGNRGSDLMAGRFASTTSGPLTEESLEADMQDEVQEILASLQCLVWHLHGFVLFFDFCFHFRSMLSSYYRF
jgi:CCDC93, coiled-coil domain